MKSRASIRVPGWYRAMLVLFVLFFVTATDAEANAIAMLAFVLIVGICVGLVLLTDTRLLTLPFLLVCMVLAFCYDSYDLFIRYLWLLPVGITALTVHLVRLRPRFRVGPSLLPLLAVALATALGGVGHLPAVAYRTPLMLYYILGLGVGMVLIYLILKNEVRTRADVQSLIEDIALLALTAAAVVFLFVIKHNTPARPGFRFQWKNNIATMIMIGLPAVVSAARRHPPRLLIGVFVYVAALMTCSRGAWIFASVEFFLCVLWLFFLEKRRFWRRVYSVLLGVLVTAAGVMFVVFITHPTLFISMEEGRWDLFGQGWRDFCGSPLVGQGLGNSLNMELRTTAKGAMYWYHSFPIQIIGSMGILGALAWSWQLAVRVRLSARLWARTVFCLPLCYLGLLLMSMVNPGEFCPVPYAFLAVFIFAACENRMFLQNRWFIERPDPQKRLEQLKRFWKRLCRKE